MQNSRPTGGKPPSSAVPGSAGLNELRRMHSAIGVALALLDELLQLLPEPPGAARLKEVEDVFREIRDLAGMGLRWTRTAADLPDDPEKAGGAPG